MLRGELIPGVKYFPQDSLLGGENITRRAPEANYYRDGEWDVFSEDEWYLDDDEDSFFQSDAEDIFLSLDEEEGDASSWVSEEDGRLVRTYARVRRNSEHVLHAEPYMLADDTSDDDEEKKKDDDDLPQALWSSDEDGEELDNRIKIYMFANETGDNEPSSQDEEERRRTIHMEDYL